MKRTIIIAFTALICSIVGHAASAGNAGDSAYARQNYPQALDSYRKALDTEGASSNLYYNIGNTYYRLGNIGQAIIFYERALKVDPANEDARINRDFVKSKIVGAPEDDSSFLTNIHEGIKSRFSPDTWAWLAFAMFVITCGCVALYLFTDKIMIRKTGFFGALVSLAVFIYILAIACQTANAINDDSYAVITAPVSNLRSQPSTAGGKTDKVVPIPGGARVEIIDSLATPDDPNVSMWYEVKINNSSRAWLNAADAERI